MFDRNSLICKNPLRHNMFRYFFAANLIIEFFMVKTILYKTLSEAERALNYVELASRVLKTTRISAPLSRRVFEPFLDDPDLFLQEASGLWRALSPENLVDRLLADVTFVVVDLETTGSSAPKEGITEIGAIKLRGDTWLGAFDSLINPGRYISSKIQRLAGISNLNIHDAPAIEQVMGEFGHFCQGAVLAAHNASFDIRFLRREANRLKLFLPKHVLCTCQLSRHLLPGLDNYRLGDLARTVGLPKEDSHRALPDAKTATRLLQYMLQTLDSGDTETLKGLLQLQKKSRRRS